MSSDNRSARDRKLVRGRRARRVSRGQALVEFAMVVPLFFLMMFGFIEIALITASIATFNFAAKDAARLGSIVGPTDNTADQDMFKLIKGRVSGLVVAKLVEVEIYKSDTAGDYLLPGNTLPVEDGYDANFNPIPATQYLALWPVTSRNDTLLDADYLGVRITYRYTYLTSYLSGAGSTLTLTANSVQRIEPQDFQSRVAPPVWLAKASLAPAGGRAGTDAGASGATSGNGNGLAGVADAPVADVRRQSWSWGGAA